MKPARPLLGLLSVLGIVLVGGGVLALTPAFQRWVVLRTLAGRPGLKLEIAAVSAGYSGVSLQGVALHQNGITVKLDRLDADWALWPVLFTRPLRISRLVASGLVVDASRLSSAKAQAAAAGAPMAAPGLLAQLHLPVALVLDEVRIEGRALLPVTAGFPALAADLKISGGKFAPEAEGTLLFTAAVKNPAADAGVSALNVSVSLRALQTGQKTFSRVGLTGVVDAEGKNIADRSQLRITAELVQEAMGEDYSVRVDTSVHGTSENLLTVHASPAAGGKEYEGNWILKVRTAQLEPFFLGGALPELNAHGEGRFGFNPTTREAKLVGQLEADANRLELYEPSLRAIGTVKLSAQFNVDESDGIARLHQLDVRLAGPNPVLELHASSAAELNLREKRLQVGPSGPGEVLDLKIIGLPLAWVRPFVHEVDVSGGLMTGRITVTAEVERLLARVVEPLQVGSLSVVRRGQLLLNKADLSLAADAVLTAQTLTANITGFALKTPAGDSFTAQATVALPVSPDPAITVTASYQTDLPKLLSAWLPLGRIKAMGETDFSLTGAKLELRRLNTLVTDGGGADLFKAEALRPFTFDLATHQATTADHASADLVRITLGRIPLDHLPLDQPGAKLGGVVEQGAFVLAADGDTLTVRAISPLKLSEVSLTQGGQPALTGLHIEAQPGFELTGETAASAHTGDVAVHLADGTTLLSFKGDATRTNAAGLHGALAFTIEVPVLSTQPLFAGAQSVTQGRASGEIRFQAGATPQVEARLTVNGLVAAGGGPALPVANLSFRALSQSEGAWSVQAPLLLDRAGQRSDLNFALQFRALENTSNLDGTMTGEHLELDDLLSLLAVFSASVVPPEAPPASTAASGPVSADLTPFWSHIGGRVTLDVKSVTAGANWAMTGLSGLAVIEPSLLALPKLEADFGGNSRLSAKGSLAFTAGAEPYRLTGDFSLTEFDAGKFFKAIAPGKPPTVEGLFSITGQLAGHGETLPRVLERTRGEFALTSRQGVFRGLQRVSKKVSMTSKAVELSASVLGSIFGSDRITKAAEKVAGSAYFVDQLAGSLAEFNYDQLSVRLVRDETLNLALEDITLISPEIRLSGKGTVTYAANHALLEQPLTVSLAFAGRGKIEQLLGKLRLTDGTRDELGYALAREPVIIGGTLARPDATLFFTKLASAKLSELLEPEK